MISTFGKYTIEKKLGQGGMGAVYLVVDPDLGRKVALKVITSDNQEMLERFHLETQAVAKLKHPNIVSVYETGSIPAKDKASSNQHYFTMDYIEGVSLETLIMSETKLNFQNITKIVLQVASALHYAHNQKIIHRDVKPANILIDKNGRAYLTDFGLAKQLTGIEKSLTMSGTTIGTPSYMPPEQAMGKKQEIDPRSDVYALGATLYYCLTGQVPFTGSELYDVLNKVINEDPSHPSTIVRQIPRDIEIICLKCMEKEPLKRYQSCQELADDLTRFLEGDIILAKPASTWTKVWRKARHNKTAFSITTIALAILIISGFLFITLNIREKQRMLIQQKEQQEKKASDIFRTAQVFINNGDFAGANKNLQEIISKYPDTLSYIKAYWEIVRIIELEKKQVSFDQIGWLKKIISITKEASQASSAYIKLAQIYERYGYLADAKHCYKESLAGLDKKEAVDVTNNIKLLDIFGKPQKIINNPVESMAVADIDKDGNNEILTVEGSKLVIRRYNGESCDVITDFQLTDNKNLGWGCISVGDFNNDNELEIMVFKGGPEGGIHMLKYKESTIKQMLFIELPNTGLCPPIISDVNGDGNSEVLLGLSYSGRTARILRFQGSELVNDVKFYPRKGEIGSDVKSIISVDLDGGTPEIIMALGHWNGYEIRVYSRKNNELVLKTRKLVGVIDMVYLGENHFLCLKSPAKNKGFFGHADPCLEDSGPFILKYENASLKKVWEDPIAVDETETVDYGLFSSFLVANLLGNDDKYFMFTRGNASVRELYIYRLNDMSSARLYKILKFPYEGYLTSCAIDKDGRTEVFVFGKDGVDIYGKGEVDITGTLLSDNSAEEISETLFKTGCYSEARQQYWEIFSGESNPAKQANLLLKISKTYELSGDVTKALDTLKRVEDKFDSHKVDAIREQTRIYEKESMWEQAVICAERLMSISGNPADLEEKISLYRQMAGLKSKVEISFSGGIGPNWNMRNPLGVSFDPQNLFLDVKIFRNEEPVIDTPIEWNGDSFSLAMDIEPVLVEWWNDINIGLHSPDNSEHLTVNLYCFGGGGILNLAIQCSAQAANNIINKQEILKSNINWDNISKEVRKIKVEFIKPLKEIRIFVSDDKGEHQLKSTKAIEGGIDFKPGRWRLSIASLIKGIPEKFDYISHLKLRSLRLCGSGVKLADTTEEKEANTASNMANIKFVNRRYTEAIPLYEKTVSESPDNSLAQLYLLLARLKSGEQTEDITTNLRKLIDKHDDLLKLLQRTIRYDDDCYNKVCSALLDKKEFTDLRVDHAELLYYNLKYNDALFILRGITDIGDDSRLRPKISNIMGDSYYQLGMLEESKKCYQAIVDSEPNSSGAYVMLAKISAKQDKTEEARNLIKQAIDKGYDYIRLQANSELLKIVSEEQIEKWFLESQQQK